MVPFGENEQHRLFCTSPTTSGPVAMLVDVPEPHEPKINSKVAFLKRSCKLRPCPYFMKTLTKQQSDRSKRYQSYSTVYQDCYKLTSRHTLKPNDCRRGENATARTNDPFAPPLMMYDGDGKRWLQHQVTAIANACYDFHRNKL
jgi:hypothetical protein